MCFESTISFVQVTLSPKHVLRQIDLEESNGYSKADFAGSLGCKGVTVPLDVDTMYPIGNFVITQVDVIAD